MTLVTFTYSALLTPGSDRGFIVQFPDVPSALTHGDTFEEALVFASEALGLALRGEIADLEQLPEPLYQGGVPVSPDAQDCAKLAVILAFRQSGISKSELARRIGRSDTEARRILDPDHGTKLDLLQQALRALGKRLVISMTEAA
jgi:antitoxin HicB